MTLCISVVILSSFLSDFIYSFCLFVSPAKGSSILLLQIIISQFQLIFSNFLIRSFWSLFHLLIEFLKLIFPFLFSGLYFIYFFPFCYFLPLSNFGLYLLPFFLILEMLSQIYLRSFFLNLGIYFYKHPSQNCYCHIPQTFIYCISIFIFFNIFLNFFFDSFFDSLVAQECANFHIFVKISVLLLLQVLFHTIMMGKLLGMTSIFLN